MYQFVIDKINQAFIITLAGSFGMEEGIKFVQDYQKETNRPDFDPRDYVLVVDGTNMLPVMGQDVQKALESVIKMYMETPFFDRIRVDLKYAAMLLQIRRLGQDDVIYGFHQAHDIADALAAIPELFKSASGKTFTIRHIKPGGGGFEVERFDNFEDYKKLKTEYDLNKTPYYFHVIDAVDSAKESHG